VAQRGDQLGQQASRKRLSRNVGLHRNVRILEFPVGWEGSHKPLPFPVPKEQKRGTFRASVNEGERRLSSVTSENGA